MVAAEYEPIGIPAYHDAVGICTYGCGQRYATFVGTRLRGHPWCLVELGADLLALVDRFPQVTYVRLAADIGLQTRVVTKILQAAMVRRTADVTPRSRPARLTGRQFEVFRIILGYWREFETLPDYLELSQRARIGMSTAGGYLSHLRFAGWLSRRSVLHLPACALAPCRDGCPYLAGAR